MITEFSLTDQEAMLAEVFSREHRHENMNKGAIGGHISYTFTPNAIGTSVVIRCNICDQEENITEYNW